MVSWRTGFSYWRCMLSARVAARRGVTTFLLQSCDSGYRPLLSVTAPANRAYARRHGYGFFSCLGNLPPIPSTANFNRYYLLRDMMQIRGLKWAFWLDADAMIVDPSRRLEEIIGRDTHKMLIACSGKEKGVWDINNGVFLLNLQHAYTEAMLHYVITFCERLPAVNQGFVSDQRPMQRFLLGLEKMGRLNDVATTYSGDSRSLFNYSGAFVRHAFRTHGDMAERVAELQSVRQEGATAE